MGRPVQHPSGPGRTICVSLPPHHIQILDDLAQQRRGQGRSAIIRRLLEDAAATNVIVYTPGDEDTPDSYATADQTLADDSPTIHIETGPEPGCTHPLTKSAMKGPVRRCEICGHIGPDKTFTNDR